MIAPNAAPAPDAFDVLALRVADALRGLDLQTLDRDAIAAELARKDFQEFRRRVNVDADGKPLLLEAAWQQYAAKELEDFFAAMIRGERPILVLTVPPQHGKTFMIRDFVAWALGRLPDLRVAYASYSDELGIDANYHVQRLLTSTPYNEVFPGTAIFAENVVTQSNKPRRHQHLLEIVGRRGFFRNTSLGGPLTGKAVDLAVIDDPVKGRQEAESEVERKNAWDWHTNVLTTRMHKNSAILLIQTRWHLDDYAGRLIKIEDEAAAAAGRPSRVRRVNFVAIAHEDEPFRKAGEALFPELHPLDSLLEKKAVMDALNPADWSALFEGNPIPREGSMIKAEWFGRYKERGTNPNRIIMSGDCASKAKERNDPSAWLIAAEWPGRIEIWWCDANRREFPDLLQFTKDLYGAPQWEVARGPTRPNVVLIEDKDSGQALIQTLRADRESRLPVVAHMPHKDKPMRMGEESPVIQAGKVWLPESAVGNPWLPGFVTEITTFPAAAHDDRVDAFSQLLNYVRLHPLQVNSPGPIGLKKATNRGIGN